MITLNWKSTPIIFVGVIFLSLGGLSWHYYSSLQDVKKKLQSENARTEALQDSLRLISSSTNKNTYGKLSFPSEDSLKKYTESNFDVLNQKNTALKKNPSNQAKSGVSFSWKPEDLIFDSTLTQEKRAADSSIFEVDITKRNYQIRGEVIVSGYRGGKRNIQYDLQITQDENTFDILRSQSGPREEVYIQSSGEVTSVRSYHDPRSNKPATLSPYAKSGFASIGKNISGVFIVGAEREVGAFTFNVGTGPAYNLLKQKTTFFGTATFKFQF